MQTVILAPTDVSYQYSVYNTVTIILLLIKVNLKLVLLINDILYTLQRPSIIVERGNSIVIHSHWIELTLPMRTLAVSWNCLV